MKKNKILISLAFSFFAFSSAANAANATSAQEQAMILKQICGMRSDLGNSSIFGARSYYSQNFPKVGLLSDELEHIKGISIGRANAVFQKSYEYQKSMIKAVNQTNKEMNQRSDYIEDYNSTMDYVNEKYKGTYAQLLKQKDYNDTKSAKEALNSLSSKDRKQYEQCVNWWYHSNQGVVEFGDNLGEFGSGGNLDNFGQGN